MPARRVLPGITDQLPHTVDWLSRPPIPGSRSVPRWNRCLHDRILLFLLTLHRYFQALRSCLLSEYFLFQMQGLQSPVHRLLCILHLRLPLLQRQELPD